MRGFVPLVILTVAWGAFAFGAVYPWAYWPLATASATLGIWGLAGTRSWDDPRVRRVAWALIGVAVAIGMQLVPLPDSWLTHLSPGVDRVLNASVVGFTASSRHTLSLAPWSTAVVLALFGAFALLLLGLIRSLRLVQLETLVRSLVVLGVVLALIGVVQAASLDRNNPLVYGFWAPAYGATPFGPFINKNHFAGWMVMVVPVTASYLLAIVATTRPRRDLDFPGMIRWMLGARSGGIVIVAVSLLIMMTSVVLTGSRSGMAGMLLALVVIGLFLWAQPQAEPARGPMISGLAALSAGAVMWAGLTPVLTRLGYAAGGLSGRWDAWQDTLRIVRDFFMFGTGLGTFARAMLVYQTGDRTSIYAQAHSDYLQLAAEGGLLVVLPAIAAVGVIGWGIWRRFESTHDDLLTRSLRAGAVAGLVAMAAQSLVEFSLQMPGNTVMFVLLLGIALHRPHHGLTHAHRV